MFSRRITETDDFLNLSKGAQCLYLHLCMEADDDGVLDSITGTMRKCEATEAEFDELIQTGYILPAVGKVFVITHWNVNNSIPKARYHKSRTIDVKQFFDEEDGVYKPRVRIF